MWHLGRVLAFGGLMAVLALLAQSEVVAQKKKDKGIAKDNGYAATAADYTAIQKVKELTGTVVAVSGQVFTLRTDSPHLEANPKYKPTGNNVANQQYRTQQELMRAQQQAAKSKNPLEAQRAMQRIQQDLARLQMQMQQQNAQLLARAAKDPNYDKNNANNTTDPFIVVHAYKEYDLEIQDEASVRKMFLPLEYDDVGKLKTYTEKEKNELRGPDKSKPGYMAKLDAISNGMEAKLTLTPPPAKKKERDAKDDDTEVERPKIKAIMLTKDAPPPATTPDDAKKKKKAQ